jgi:hypothetical protein
VRVVITVISGSAYRPQVEGELMMDLLWSDPTEDDTQQGIQANLRRGQASAAAARVSAA